VIAAVLLGECLQGAVATALTGVSPLLTLWLPFVALVALPLGDLNATSAWARQLERWCSADHFTGMAAALAFTQ
jgi:hypothetical protein